MKPAYLAVRRAALERGHDVLATSTCRPTGAQVAVHRLHSFEHSLLPNAGLHATRTEEGRVECEASVVCGRTHLVSSCGAELVARAGHDCTTENDRKHQVSAMFTLRPSTLRTVSERARFLRIERFFPGTGHLNVMIAYGEGKQYAVNFPCRDGTDDESCTGIFRSVLAQVRDLFAPGAVLLSRARKQHGKANYACVP
ncbi:hypothetical protein PsorP6_010342 [Peronosclerospora sorghi]|uniref:Uncharacterized protein n=1 Tax=Peronosclerospora sorghi TaxID=230839 RepID=A0ACC0VWU5_9STRA|nr:hypothetical protein PsorP6_010342 [Peronosclerospora sorghi]